MDGDDNKLFSAIRLLFPYYTLLLALLLVDYFIFGHYFFNKAFAGLWIFVFLILETVSVLDFMIRWRAINLHNKWVVLAANIIFIFSLLAAILSSYGDWSVTVWLVLSIISGALMFSKRENVSSRFARTSFRWFFSSYSRRFCFLFLITAAVFTAIYFRSSHFEFAAIPISVIGGLAFFTILWYVVGDSINHEA